MAQPMQHQANQSMQNLLEQARIADEAGAWVMGMYTPSSLSDQQALPYLAVPRDRPVRTEVEILREQLAAAKAELDLTKLSLAYVAALTPPEPAPVPNPMTRAVSRWPGSVGFMQGLRWRGV
jgi:hypothetical protein